MVVSTKHSNSNARITDLPDFAQEGWWKVFLPTLYDRFFMSDEPFAKFIKGSQPFIAFIQANIGLVYPQINYKVATTDAIHFLVCPRLPGLKSHSCYDLWILGVQPHQWEKIHHWFHGSYRHRITPQDLQWWSEWACQLALLGLVFGSPVSWLEKDRNQTGPRPQKTGPAVRSFYFWDVKTAKKPVNVSLSWPV